MALLKPKILVSMGLDKGNLEKGLKEEEHDLQGVGKATHAASHEMTGLKGTIHRVHEMAAGFLEYKLIEKGVEVIKENIGEIIKDGEDLQQTVLKTNDIFGESSKEIQEWAEGGATSMGLAEGAALSYADKFGQLLTNMGVGTKEALEWSEAMTQTVADVASFNNVDPAGVAKAFTMALNGNVKGLKQYGIVVTNNDILTEAMAETGKKNAKELTKQELATARYNVVMKASEKYSGTFAKRSHTLAGAMKVFHAELGNVREEIGMKLVPVLTMAAVFVVTLLTTFDKFRKKGMSPFMAAVNTLHALLVGAFGQKKADSITATILDFKDTVVSVFHELVKFAKAVWPTILKVLMFIGSHAKVIAELAGGIFLLVKGVQLYNKAMKIYAQVMKVAEAVTAGLDVELLPLILIFAAIAAAAALFYFAWKGNWFGIRDITHRVINWVFKLVKPFLKLIKNIGTYWHDVFTGKIGPGNLKNIPGWLQPIVLIVGRVVKTLRIFIKTWKDKGLVAALKIIPVQIRAFGRAVANLFEQMGLHRTAQLIKKTFYDIAKLFTDVSTLVGDIIHGRWSKVWDDFKRVAMDVVRLMIDRVMMVPSLILDIFDAINWGAVGKGLRSAGKFVMRQLWDGVKSLSSWLLGNIGGVIGNMKSTIERYYNTFYDVGKYLLGAVGSGIESVAWSLVSDVWSAFNKVVTTLEGFYNTIYDVGKYLFSGLWSGMQEIWNGVTGWLSKLDPSKYKGPPSRDKKMLVGNGKLIMAGLGMGLKTGWKDVTKQLQGYRPGVQSGRSGAGGVAPIANRQSVHPSVFTGAGASVTVNVNGANLTNEQVGQVAAKAVIREIRRLKAAGA